MRWTKWEYWPYWLFYFPVYIQYLYYVLRTGSPAFFSAANPSMFLGGFVAYSKFDILSRIPAEYRPAMMFLHPDDTLVRAMDKMEKRGIGFPIIVKPDKGERGFGVNILDNEQSLATFMEDRKNAYIIQEYVDFPMELGVMYYRMPGESKGTITSVVKKEFLMVKGDGRQTLGELIKRNDRACTCLPFLRSKFKNLWHSVPKNEEEIILESIGNHRRGTKFIDGREIIDQGLKDIFDEIAGKIHGFHFGRFDLRVTDLEALKSGENIKILEVNGANSEPAHIYDPEMSIFKAYGHLFAHWKTLYKVSRANHKNGVAYYPFKPAYQSLRSHLKQRRTYL